MNKFEKILTKPIFSREDIVELLSSEGTNKEALFEKAAETKKQYLGNKVFFRGLIEFSNICVKNCYYCGIRAKNNNVKRYFIEEKEIIEAAKYAHKNQFGSIVIQAGERKNKDFIEEITHLLKKIQETTNGELGITLSLGEQTEATYNLWKKNGAQRYLLRIETSNEFLYKKIHPNNIKHSFNIRINSLELLKKIGFQVGTGVMIGFPFQTLENLADDLLFMKKFDIDMVGMGPYIEHINTPLYQYRKTLLHIKTRFEISLKMIAVLRIMMKDINIAATTAMQTIDALGREKAIQVGANVIMPNLTPEKYRENYLLYKNKPCFNEETNECKTHLEKNLKKLGAEIGYGEWGNSKHYYNRIARNDTNPKNLTSKNNFSKDIS